jgi:hypothetical protein
LGGARIGLAAYQAARVVAIRPDTSPGGWFQRALALTGANYRGVTRPRLDFGRIADSVLPPGLLDHRGKPRRTALI